MLIRSLSTLLAFFVFLAPAVCETLTIYAQSVVDKKAPSSILKLSFDAKTLTANVTSYQAPSASHGDESPIRIGLYESGGLSSGKWSSAVYTTAGSFHEKYQKRLQLYVDDSGTVWNVGFSSSLKAPEDEPKDKGTKRTNKKGKGQKEEVLVEVVKQPRGPSPFLNKPVVLGADGKMEPKEPEKSLFQK
jgi:hypothetical protein